MNKKNALDDVLQNAAITKPVDGGKEKSFTIKGKIIEVVYENKKYIFPYLPDLSALLKQFGLTKVISEENGISLNFFGVADLNRLQEALNPEKELSERAKKSDVPNLPKSFYQNSLQIGNLGLETYRRGQITTIFPLYCVTRRTEDLGTYNTNDKFGTFIDKFGHQYIAFARDLKGIENIFKKSDLYVPLGNGQVPYGDNASEIVNYLLA